jgi:hypothetical protein
VIVCVTKARLDVSGALFILLSLERDVILELCFVGDVGGGVDAGECAEIVNEMRLVEVAARQRDLRPVDDGASRGASDVTQNFLETLHAAKQLWSKADLLRKKLDEAAIAETNLICYGRDGASRALSEILDGERHGWMRWLKWSIDALKKCVLEDFELRLGRTRAEKLFA